jgi:hypothetical protein
VIPQLANRLAAHRVACGNPTAGPIFANTLGKPLALDIAALFDQLGLALLREVPGVELHQEGAEGVLATATLQRLPV